MSVATVLVIDRSDCVRRELRAGIQTLGFRAVLLASIKDVDAARVRDFQLVVGGEVSDSPGEVLHLVETLRSEGSSVPVMLYLSATSEEIAIQAMRLRVTDLFRQPNCKALLNAVQRQLEDTTDPPAEGLAAILVGGSPTVKRTRDYLAKSSCHRFQCSDHGRDRHR